MTPFNVLEHRSHASKKDKGKGKAVGKKQKSSKRQNPATSKVTIRDEPRIDSTTDDDDSDWERLPPEVYATSSQAGGSSSQPPETETVKDDEEPTPPPHIPDKYDMIPDKEDGSYLGQPINPQLLFSYKDSWARYIYQTYVRCLHLVVIYYIYL